MLDIKFIIDNPELVKEGLAKKGYTPEQIDIDALIALHKDVNKLKTSTQALAEEKNRLSNSIKSASADERPAIIAKSREIGEELKKEQEQLTEEQQKYDSIMWRMPNLPSPESPVAPDESGNVVIKKVGEPTKFDFTPKDHVELMELNDWSEMERITKVSGARTYAIKNELSRLELAMHMLVLDKLAAHGFTTITVPSLSKQNRYMEWAICRFLRTKSIICRPMTFTSPARPNWCSIRCAPMKFFPKTTCRCSTPDSPPVFAAKQEPLAKIRAVWFASISF